MMGAAMPNVMEPDRPGRAERPNASRRRPRGARWIGYGAVGGAALALVASLVLPAYGITLPGLPNAPDEPEAFSAPAGSCLDWTSADAGDAQVVDCTGQHLFEVVGNVDLTSIYGPASAFPTDIAWQNVVQQKCAPLATDYLAGRYDPFGRFAIGALKPSQPGWRAGDRTLHCGLQISARSGALFHVVTSAKTVDQSNVHEPGTCLGIDGVDVGDPVDCALLHAVEVVGNVDVGVLLPSPDYPSEESQDQVLDPACAQLADQFAGAAGMVAEKKLTVFWDTLKPESWQAGTRKVDCKLGALLPDKSGFAPITGGVRGVVVIGEAPAPPAQVTATPGAPVDMPPLILPTTPPPVPTTPPPGEPPPESPAAPPPGTGAPSPGAPPEGG